jgi:succinylglutamate desuccinylase
MARSDDLSTPPRLIASLRGEAPGPALIVIGGLHGNEPSGVTAMRSVAAALAREPLPLRGDLTMLAGNVAALARGARFVDHDLNRGWTDERLAMLRAAPPGALDAEDREQRALADDIERALGASRGPAYLLDLHATSAAGIPFSLCRDVAPAREFARAFPVTLVLGLLEALSGTLAGWVGARCTAAVVEGGQNSDPATARNHEAVIWLALAAAGIVAEGDAPALPSHRATLSRARGDLPPVLQVHHRHAIAPEDRFRMEPGYANIQRVAANELLARDRAGEIRAPGAGFVLLPLYQAMGDDGFFLGREAEATKAS